MKVTNMLAKALYDNKAECSDELAFRKGDILTVLEKNILGSEGWWRCYLHGKQGLAPANRLQLFTIPQNESPSNYNSLTRRQSNQNIYQVPSAPKTEPATMYEKMDNLYITPPAAKTMSGDIYQTPLSSPAEIVYEKANSNSNQHLFTLPRASKASSISKGELYDVPPSKMNTSSSGQRGRTPSPVNGRSPFLSTMEQSQQQQIYDIPSSPDTPDRSNNKTYKASNVYDIPPTGTLQRKRSDTPPVAVQYNTLPNPRRSKSDWIYDIPLSPERNILKANCRKISVDQSMVYDVPPARYSPVHSKRENGTSPSQIYDIPPNKSPATSQCLYDIPASRDGSSSYQNGSLRKGSLSFGKPTMENFDTKENVYDIPRGSGVGSPLKTEVSSSTHNDRIYDVPPPLPKDKKPSLQKCDRFSVSSSESRTSTLSTSSTVSSESVALSTSEDSSSETTLEPEVVIKNITELQERVSSSIASLMIFVSSKWRLQENMESNLEDIHRAVDSIIYSLRKFIDFAQTIKANTVHLTDLNIQTRINTQLQTLSDSLQTLSRNQESINVCDWSLQALVIDKPRTTADDLDQFVMVARTIPEDIKRFVSIIIANGKLLFKKQEEKRPKSEKEYSASRKPQVPTRPDTKVLQEFCINRAEDKSKHKKYQLQKQKSVEDSGYVYLQKKEDFEKTLTPMQQLERKTSPEEKRRGWLKPDSRIQTNEELRGKNVASKEPPVPPIKPDPLQKPGSVKKLALSEPCYLYFGALQKAIRVFGDSLGRNEAPEVFISHGKLIIMVGQKLVDMLCQDAKVGEARNGVLYKSSELCGLLKNLAMATKTAAIQYPNTSALLELRQRTAELSDYTQLFRSMLE